MSKLDPRLKDVDAILARGEAAADGLDRYIAESERTGYVVGQQVREAIVMHAQGQRAAEPAMRLDAGKSRVDLIPADFILALGEHYGAGAKKYAERNWEKGMSYSRCYASAQRHMLAFWSGEEFDEQTGSPHTICAIWNMVALFWYQRHARGTDDRFTPQEKTP